MPIADGARALALAFACGAAVACGGTRSPAARQPVPAGSPAADRTAAPPIATASASLAGTVRDAASDRPLARARLVLTSAALGQPRVTISGAGGSYGFDRLPPGSYMLSVSRTGYAATDYGTPAAPLVLAEGQRVGGIDLSLARGGVIHGRVLDEDGEPFAGAVVNALVSHFDSGQPTMVSVATARTDDRGEFRLGGLAAGQYYVSAFDPAFAGVGDESGPLRYTPTYYPGVVLPSQAGRVRVTPGSPGDAIAFRLQIVRPSSVSGRLLAVDERPLLSGAVVMSALSEGEAFTPTSWHDVRILPDGSFTFRNVSPGRYQIRARGQTERNGTPLFAVFSLVMRGAPISGVDMVLQPGAGISGTLDVEGSRPSAPAFAGLRVRAPFADGSSFGDAVTGLVAPDGTFLVEGLISGTHAITVEGLEAPWVVKRVDWRGRDISDRGIEVEPRRQYRDVRVTITDVASDLSGVVREPTGRPVPDALVVIVPAAAEAWLPANRRFALVHADAGGRYHVRGLPTGEYRLVASVDLDEVDLLLPGRVRALAALGTPLSLADVEARVLDLPLTAESAHGRALSR